MRSLSVHVGTAADYPDFVRFFAQLENDDPVPGPEVWEREIAPDSLFLKENGRNIAYARAICYGTEAHVATVVVDEPWRRRGVGRALLLALGERLSRAGCRSIRLHVKVGNEPAIRLYARLGLEVHQRSAVLRLPWRAVARLPVPSAVVVRPPSPDGDEALARWLDLRPEVVARWRERGDALFCAEAGGVRSGFARANSLGIMPFRAADPGLARALLESIRAGVPVDATHVQLVVEGQEELAARLRDAGAVLLFEIFQMRGPVPGS